MTLTGSTPARLGLALLAGFAVTVLLFPASGIDPLPPRCFSSIGYEVPCWSGFAPLVGFATAGVVFVALWRWGGGR